MKRKRVDLGLLVKRRLRRTPMERRREGEDSGIMPPSWVVLGLITGDTDGVEGGTPPLPSSRNGAKRRKSEGHL